MLVLPRDSTDVANNSHSRPAQLFGSGVVGDEFVGASFRGLYSGLDTLCLVCDRLDRKISSGTASFRGGSVC